jgi:outer membrane murein-binding lipoprotein Lpp
MKTIIRSVCVVLALVVLGGCKSEEEYQKLQDKCTALDQQYARAQQDIQALQNAIQQKDAEVAARVQDADQRVQAMMVLLKKKDQEVAAAKGGKAAVKSSTATKKSSTSAKSAKKH